MHASPQVESSRPARCPTPAMAVPERSCCAQVSHGGVDGSSDHRSVPWPDFQRHAPYAWRLLGVAAQAASGDHQQLFPDWAQKILLPALRER